MCLPMPFMVEAHVMRAAGESMIEQECASAIHDVSSKGDSKGEDAPGEDSDGEAEKTVSKLLRELCLVRKIRSQSLEEEEDEGQDRKTARVYSAPVITPHLRETDQEGVASSTGCRRGPGRIQRSRVRRTSFKKRQPVVTKTMEVPRVAVVPVTEYAPKTAAIHRRALYSQVQRPRYLHPVPWKEVKRALLEADFKATEQLPEPPAMLEGHHRPTEQPKDTEAVDQAGGSGKNAYDNSVDVLHKIENPEGTNPIENMKTRETNNNLKRDETASYHVRDQSKAEDVQPPGRAVETTPGSDPHPRSPTKDYGVQGGHTRDENALINNSKTINEMINLAWIVKDKNSVGGENINNRDFSGNGDQHRVPPMRCRGGSEGEGSMGCPKVVWAVTKINIYPDDSRTYEVMKLSSQPPCPVPTSTDSIFVLVPPSQQNCNK